MIRVTATEELRFTGYGVRLYPGVNELPDKIPYGLKKSLERRARFGQVTIEHVPDAQGESPATGASSSAKSQSQGEGRRKRRRRRRDRAEESVSTQSESTQPVEPQSSSVAQELVERSPETGLDFGAPKPDPEPD
jgi:hypothetical protein